MIKTLDYELDGLSETQNTAKAFKYCIATIPSNRFEEQLYCNYIS